MGTVKRWLGAGALTLAAAGALVAPSASVSAGRNVADAPISHVLLLSVDGLHQSDLATYVAQHPTSWLARLSDAGTTYTDALTTRPSDSFPGMLGPLTGGTPKTTGVFYDDSYDRTLYPVGSGCTGPVGTETLYDESIDVGATTSTRTIMGETIDPTQLPETLTGAGCEPVYPSDFLRTNTIFSVAHAAGLATAWSDKHPAYEIVNGHGTPGAVDDLFTPEINADIVPSNLTDTRGNTITFPFPSSSSGGPAITDFVGNTEAYDQLKVDAILNEIDGHRSDDSVNPNGTPAIFGMNFQSVSVAEKDVDPALTCDGSRNFGYPCDPTYFPGGYEPGSLAFTPQMEGSTCYTTTTFTGCIPGALDYVNTAIGQIVTELQSKGELASTRIIIEAKHGQSPIDPAQLQKIGHAVGDVIGNSKIAQLTDDDVALVWLNNQADAGAAAHALQSSPGRQQANVDTVFSGQKLAKEFGDPTTNARTPDLIVQPTQGTIYSHSHAKVAEHGGFADPDRHVALLVSDGSRFGDNAPVTDTKPVETTQIAPTILDSLGLDPQQLDAVRAEGTQPLPGLGF